MKRAGVVATVLLALLARAPAPEAQELEPRLFSRAPVGTNFLAAGYGFSFGNVMLDPAVPIEDLDGRVHRIFAGYVRVFDFFGVTGKVDLLVPTAFADFEGTLEGEPAQRTINGFGDPMARLAVLLYGAPARRGESFLGVPNRPVLGLALQVRVPLGQYDPDKLFNLGLNRWTFRPMLGISYILGHWVLEATVSGWFFTKNDEFLGDSTLEQRPLFAIQGHVGYVFGPGLWLALDLAYGTGGRTVIDGVERDNRQENFRLGLTLSVPLAAQHSLKLAVISGANFGRGQDYNTAVLAYIFRWGGD